MMHSNLANFLLQLTFENTHEQTFLKNIERHSAIINILMRNKNIKECRILDFGSGDSILSKFLNLEGLNCENYEPFSTAEQEEYYSRNNISVIKDAETLVNAPAYDVIIFSEVIEHVAIPKPIFDLLNQISRPGTELILSTPNFMRLNMWLSVLFRRRAHPVLIADWLNKTNDYQKHCREFSGLEIKEMLSLNNYANIEIDYTEIDYTAKKPSQLRDFKPKRFKNFFTIFFPTLRNNIFATARKLK